MYVLCQDFEACDFVPARSTNTTSADFMSYGPKTLLLLAKSPKHYRILASTEATAPALGDVQDKLARELVPASSIPQNGAAVCYPKIMDDLFYFGGPHSAPYRPPTTRKKELEVFRSAFKWQLTPPLRESRELRFDFSALQSRALEILRDRPDMSMDERRELWLHASRLAFEHVTGRVILAMETDEELLQNPPKALLVSGGVACSTLLRQVLKDMLAARGYGHLELTVANKVFCTDNAVMVAYSGYKMYTDGWQSDRAFAPQVKWSIEEILTGVDCWARRPGFSAITPEEAQAWPLQPTADAETEQDDRIEMTSDEEAFLEEAPRSEEETDLEAEVSEDAEDTSANAAPEEKDTLDLILEQVLKDTEDYLEQIGEDDDDTSVYRLPPKNQPPPAPKADPHTFKPPASLTSRPVGLVPPAQRTTYPDDEANRPVAQVKSQARTSISRPQTPHSSDLSNVDRSTENTDGAYFEGRSYTNFQTSQPTGVKNADARSKPQRHTSESKPPTPERPDRSNVDGSNEDGSTARIDLSKYLPSFKYKAFKNLNDGGPENANASSKSQGQTLASRAQKLAEEPDHSNLLRIKRSHSVLTRPEPQANPRLLAQPAGQMPPDRALRTSRSIPPQKPLPPTSSIIHMPRPSPPASLHDREGPVTPRRSQSRPNGPPSLGITPLLLKDWPISKPITVRFLGSEEEPKKPASLTDKVAGLFSGWLGRK